MTNDKILFVDQSGQLGGAELCLADLARHYGPRAAVLLLADGPFAEQLRNQRIKVEILPLPGSLARLTKKASPLQAVSALPSAAGHLLAIRREFSGAGVIYLNTAKALLYGAAANFLSSRPAIFHLHDLLSPKHFSAMNIRLMVGAANRMQAVIANSQATADSFVAAGGRVKTHVIPNGFDPQPFDAVTPEEMAIVRQQWNPGGEPVAAIFGRISRWKGQDVLIRAAAKVPHLVLWIVGDALFTEDDKAYAAELRQLAQELGVAERVHFLGFQDQVTILMRAADIIVHCSVSPEPFGRVLVEAMLARKPVIAAAAGGPLEIIEHEKTGLLTPPGDTDALAAAIINLVESPTMRVEMGRHGRVRAESLYGLPVVLAQTDAVISSVLKT
ncbi:N/A [soil metagenome]